jgi:hypothetical protein
VPAEVAKSQTDIRPEQWEHLKELLASAWDLEVGYRAAYLDRVCEPSLRRTVERLLAAGQAASTEFLSDFAPILDSGSDRLIGRQIGGCRIIQQIGSGGMGEIYRAFRADDQYRKVVAIKTVLGGYESRLFVRHFKNKRQILARLEHPTIARLLDCGATEDGSPYFVMEFIDGVPIDEYCEREKLTITARLKLFCEVYRAVQDAYRHAVIHRDKPANILSTILLPFGTRQLRTCA